MLVQQFQGPRSHVIYNPKMDAVVPSHVKNISEADTR